MAEPMGLLQGTLDVLVLRTLAWQPMHGYEISRWIRDRTGGVLVIENAPLYKALHRLEAARCVAAEWGVTEHGRRARLLSPARRPAASGSRPRSRPGAATPARWLAAGPA